MQKALEMRINGTVHRVAETPPGTERWTAKCLLCEWLSGKGRLYPTKQTAEQSIRRHLRVIHDLKSEERLVEER